MFTQNLYFNNVSGTTAVPPFSPTDISNLVGWWDAAQGVTLSGSDVTAWADQSVTTGTFTKQTGTNYTYNSSGFGVNSRPYIRTKGATYYQTSSDWPSTSTSTVYIVCNFFTGSGAAPYGRWWASALDYGAGFLQLSTDGTLNQNASFSSDLSTKITPSYDTPSVIRTRWNGSFSNVRLNNGAEVASTGVLASQANGKLILGYTNLGYVNQFDVAEIIIYNKVLDAGELTQVDNYLSTKYGITL